MSFTFEDAMHVMGIAYAAGASQVRYKTTRARCRICEEQVDLVEMKLPMLTSSGKTQVWHTLSPEVHRQSCHDEDTRRLDAEAKRHPELDLWAGTGDITRTT